MCHNLPNLAETVSNLYDDPGQCDVDSEGKVESVIYHCEVTRTDSGARETYIGLTGGTFKTRWYGHIIIFHSIVCGYGVSILMVNSQ